MVIEKAKVCVAIPMNDEPLDAVSKVFLHGRTELRHNTINELRRNNDPEVMISPMLRRMQQETKNSRLSQVILKLRPDNIRTLLKFQLTLKLNTIGVLPSQ